jgi:hypothetical protein
MTLRLYPLPSLYDPDVAAVTASTPVDVSGFYVRRTFNVPWSALPTTFIFETDRPADPHTFTINRTEEITFIPGVAVASVQLQLKQGANRIDINVPAFANRGLWTQTTLYRRYDSVGHDGTYWVCLQENVGVEPEEGAFWTLTATFSGEPETTLVTVAATGVQTWLQSLGREVYLSGGKRIREVEAQLLSPWSTRLSSHFLPFTDLFLPARMPKIHQTKLAIATIMGGRLGYGDGVLNIASSVSYSTPWVTKARNSEFDVPGLDVDYSYVTTFPTTGEDKGRVLDIWSPNRCLASKLALSQLTLTVGANDVPEPRPLQLVGFDDYQVQLKVGGGPTEVHVIDPLSAECADIEFSTDCAGSVTTFVEFDGVLDIFMTTPQLPFDMAVENPLMFGFWDEGNAMDMSQGSGSPGLGAGDDVFDTVDPDDPFGTGFLGVSLSRRFDAPMCLDTRLQIGQRMVKFVPPVTDNRLTPIPDLTQAGTPLTVLTSPSGAPPATTGTSTIWAVSPQTFIYQGDYVRLENPDEELKIDKAFPVFDALNILKNDNLTVVITGTKVTITGPLGFFEPRHEGMGIQVGSEFACISAVEISVLNATATLAGNASITAGLYSVNVYLPVRDPRVVNGAPFAGDRLFQIEFASTLPADLLDETVLDQRHAPLVVGDYLAGVSVIQLASDVVPRPNDRVFFDDSTFRTLVLINDTGLRHHTTGFKIYEVMFDAVIPAAVVDDQPLRAVVHNACWLGDPVTPLRLFSFSSPSFIVVIP